MKNKYLERQISLRLGSLPSITSEFSLKQGLGGVNNIRSVRRK